MLVQHTLTYLPVSLFNHIVDADFIQTALDQRLDLRTNIPKVLCDASKQSKSQLLGVFQGRGIILVIQTSKA